MSFRPSPVARSAFSRRVPSATIDRIHVFVAPTGKTDEQPDARSHLLGDDPRLMQRVGRLQCRHDPLEARAKLEGGERVLVGYPDVLHALGVMQVRVLRSHAGIVEARGYRMRRHDLAIAIL